MAVLTELPLDHETRAADLRRMKGIATGLLLVAAVVYAATTWWEANDAPGWVGYLRAAAEAGMIGGLADWFAVTALFRHPLGIPIPHTAIIPRKKDQLGESLSTFVGENFLLESTVRQRVDRIDVAGRVGAWVSQRANAERATAEIAAVLSGALTVVRDDHLRASLEFALMRRAAVTDVSRPLGRLLGQVVADGGHHGLVDVIVESTWTWIKDNRETVLRVVKGQAPTWSPTFVDDAVSRRVYDEVLRTAAEVRADPHHRIRATFDRLLAQLAVDLQQDPDTIARVQRAKDGLLTHPEARRVLDDLWSSLRDTLAELVEDPDSGLRQQVTDQLVALGDRLVAEPTLRDRVNGWAQDAAAHVVVGYRDQITSIITDTVEAWDAEETSARVEVQVGRDLQFIRINGFVVGALVGVILHAVTTVLV